MPAHHHHRTTETDGHWSSSRASENVLTILCVKKSGERNFRVTCERRHRNQFWNAAAVVLVAVLRTNGREERGNLDDSFPFFRKKKKFISCSAKLNWKTNQISINCIWCLCEWLFITSSIDSTDLLVRFVAVELFANPAASRTLQLSSQRLTRAWNVCTRESLNISLQSLAPPESFLMCLNFNLWIPTSEALATVSAISQCCCCFCARYEIYLIASSWARRGAREEKSHSHDEKNKNNKSNFSVIVCICSLLVEAALLISKYCPRKKRDNMSFSHRRRRRFINIREGAAWWRLDYFS